MATSDSQVTVNIGDIIDQLRRAGLSPQETLTVPGRDARLLPVPDGLHDKLETMLRDQFPKGLYEHQTDAIRRAISGDDICLATPTASGKSLVFMTVAAQIALNDRFAKILAIYPAKALIQDQLTKWQSFLEPLGMRVGFIDGSVPLATRAGILSSCRVVAMTPDVTHAWLMSHLAEKDVTHFLRHLSLVILDEAHVYDGAFGTNMAYLLRRLAIAATQYRMVCSTATIGQPVDFMKQLTGRNVQVMGPELDGSALAEKTLVLAPSNQKGGFDQAVRLLVNLATYGKVRFLAFGDSRKAVERIVAAVLRHNKDVPPDAPVDDEGEDDSDVEEPKDIPKLEHVLPYRAGYEAADRQAIQEALTQGTLAGVVSTSALELGLDIGDLDVVVLLNTPPSNKAFLQRIGRAGRRRPAVCILLDDQGVMSPLSSYVSREPEPSWLYLENRYIQYANALCTAAELQARGQKTATGLDFAGVPESFCRFVENELNPTEAVPPDLYALKQKAQSSPHYEFPIRSAAEPNFDVEGPFGLRLGTLSYAQALREA